MDVARSGRQIVSRRCGDQLLPERIYEARRAGLVTRFAHLTGAEQAGAAMTLWEAEAEARGSAVTAASSGKAPGAWMTADHEKRT